MKSKAVRYWSIIAVSVVLILATAIIVAGAGLWSSSSSTPPPPPTPGPFPTPLPYKPEGGEPVRNRDEAIRRVLLMESNLAVREQPLTTVTYVISQKTGYLLGTNNSARTRSERLEMLGLE